MKHPPFPFYETPPPSPSIKLLFMKLTSLTILCTISHFLTLQYIVSPPSTTSPFVRLHFSPFDSIFSFMNPPNHFHFMKDHPAPPSLPLFMKDHPPSPQILYERPPPSLMKGVGSFLKYERGGCFIYGGEGSIFIQ